MLPQLNCFRGVDGLPSKEAGPAEELDHKQETVSGSRDSVMCVVVRKGRIGLEGSQQGLGAARGFCDR